MVSFRPSVCDLTCGFRRGETFPFVNLDFSLDMEKAKGKKNSTKWGKTIWLANPNLYLKKPKRNSRLLVNQSSPQQVGTKVHLSKWEKIYERRRSFLFRKDGTRHEYKSKNLEENPSSSITFETVTTQLASLRHPAGLPGANNSS